MLDHFEVALLVLTRFSVATSCRNTMQQLWQASRGHDLPMATFYKEAGDAATFHGKQLLPWRCLPLNWVDMIIFGQPTNCFDIFLNQANLNSVKGRVFRASK